MILAVTGGKGGVGKSTIAYNLGAELEAVVVDADLGMADLPVGRGPDLQDVLAGRASVYEAVDESGPVALLPCGRSLAGARAADPIALGDAVRAVARRYGTALIDCPAGTRGDAGLPLAAAEACVVVTRPRRAALVDAIRVRELARTLGTPLAHVVVNRAGETPADPLARLLGGPVTRVPDSPALARAQRAGRPLGDLAPEAPAARRLAAVAAAVQADCSAR